MIRARSATRTLAASASALLVAVGCGASLPTSREAAATSTAEAVCGLLRDWSNEMAVSMNATSEALTDDDDPDTANQVLLDGWDDLIVLAEGHIAEAEALDLPVSAARDQLVEDITAGAEAAVVALEDERDHLEDLPPIEIDDQRGALGGAFTALEKAQSVVEPRIARYDDPELSAAVADEPTCEHVIQPA